jgi:OOP family OmpA-OmpF porin
MKKLLVLSAVTATLCVNVQAKEQGNNDDMWVAGFAEYYLTDEAETGLPDFFDNGTGLGAEFGYKFAPQWAARIEVSHLSIDASPTDESGNRVGADALYFLPDDLFYVFGGLKITNITEADLMASMGLGKHWNVSNNIKIITEVAAYQNLDSGEDSNTHIGFKLGLAYTFGDSTATAPSMPKDSDNDGVVDSRDQCLSTVAGTQVDAMGCTLDLDGDGVANSQDNCSNTPAGTQVDMFGCNLILDTDQDGVLDDVDQCADTPKSDRIDANGCSVFVEEEVSININVLFGNNSSVIGNANNAQFQEFADFMSRFPTTVAVIEGHASAPGNADYNMMISKKRAESVKTLLINKYGIDAARLTAEGFGETQLLDTANTAAANKTNRRITAKVSTSNTVNVER